MWLCTLHTKNRSRHKSWHADRLDSASVPVCHHQQDQNAAALHHRVFCYRTAQNYYHAYANLKSFKCDEEQPSCRNCSKSRRECLGYDPIFKSQRSTPSLLSTSASDSAPITSASAPSLRLASFSDSLHPSTAFSHTSNSPSPSSGQMEYSGTASRDRAIPSLPVIRDQPGQAHLRRPVVESHPQSVLPISQILLHPGT